MEMILDLASNVIPVPGDSLQLLKSFPIGARVSFGPRPIDSLKTKRSNLSRLIVRSAV